MKKFFKGLLVTILILIIVGGTGYIGYSFLFMNHSGHNLMSTQNDDASTNSNMSGMNMKTQQESDSNQSSSDESGKTSNMNGMSGMNMQSEQKTGTSSNNSIALTQTATIMKNKEDLSNAITGLNDALKYLTLDPYGSSKMEDMNSQSDAVNSAASNSQGNTTVNIYPQNNNTVNVIPPNSSGSADQSGNTSMQNMGTSYDPDKMEQIHTGLYKMALAMALLDQLNNDFASQAESANTNTADPISYYTYQYNLTQQNKMKLSSALNYINEAADLVNINPYISSQGLVYDKDRMEQLHQSVYTLAKNVAALNLLNEDLTKQSLSLVNLTQNAANDTSMSQMDNMSMSNGLFGGIFDNIRIESVVNIILILFVVGLILGIFGYIFSLLKQSKTQKTENL